MDDFSVRVHHRGRFCSDKGKNEYIDGEVTTVDWCDRDRWSVIEAYDVVGKLGYIAENIGVLWYKDTELGLEGLKLLKGDEEAMEMANIGVEKKVVDLYVVHKASIPDDFCYDIGYLDVGGGSKVVEEECVDADSGPSDIRQAQNIQAEAQGGGVDMEAQMQGLVDAHLSAEEVLQNIGDGDNSEEEDDTDDPDYEADSDLHFSDSEDDYCGDDGLFDVDITLGEMHQDIRKSKKSKSAVEKLKKTQKVAAGKRKSSHLSDDEGLNSDELEEVSSEDDEASKKKFPVHKELKDMSKYKWEAGTLYATREEFKEAVTSYAVHTGRNIKFPVVDNVRVRAKCGDGCEWFAYAVKMANEDSWQLRTVNDHHSCNTVFDIKVMKSKWLAKVFRRKVEENPKLKLGTIQSRTLRKWNVQISRAKAFRAKQIALVDINGTFREQYRRLYDYCHELLRTNPGSSVKLHVQLPPAAQIEHPDTTVDLSPRFHRIYICLKACKESFMKCRPMIGLDGCFLKTPYGGWLLVAMGWDPNDQMLPIAYAVVEAETKDSWTWFLSNLIDDIGVDKLLRSTFMSDQQKGLVPTFDELLPGVDHRFCVRHLYANFKKKFPGLNLKKRMWRAAKCTYLAAWEKELMEIRAISEGAYRHLIGIRPKYWTKSRFEFYPKCDALVNNMCESFNSAIVESREKPILTMLEDIRVYLMKRWAENRVLIEKYKDDILPRIKLKLQKEIDASRWWFPVAAGISKFEVIRGRDKFVVDLLKKECTCRKFQMTGLPCPHAVSAINCAKDDIRKYVSSCYTKAAYVACYTPMINPCNGHTMWERTTHPDVMPPPHRVPIGRPKKKRARGEGEEPQGPSTSRLGLQQKCSRCLKLGHNKRGCPLRRPNETTAAPFSASPAQNNNAGTATTSPVQHSTARNAGSTGSVHKSTRLASVAARPNTQPNAHKKFQPPRPTRILRSNSTSTAQGQPSSQGSQTQSALTGS
ncbi:uncharacterized protein [Arachis hypogaea]|uniref:uncharacterized protein n=1 Tax=Arachis hypogaea TaxID=3818 RepID=UPI003B21099E